MSKLSDSAGMPHGLRAFEAQAGRQLVHSAGGLRGSQQCRRVDVHQVVAHELLRAALHGQSEVDDPVATAHVGHALALERDAVAAQEGQDLVRRLIEVLGEPADRVVGGGAHRAPLRGVAALPADEAQDGVHGAQRREHELAQQRPGGYAPAAA